jgi:hypothetical protein
VSPGAHPSSYNSVATTLYSILVEGKIKEEMEVTIRRGRRRKKLLDDLREGRGYCHLKEEALNRTMWRNSFGGGIGDLSLDRLLNE